MRKKKQNKFERSSDYRMQFMRRWPPEAGGYYHCVYCGRKIKTQDMQVDHVIAVDMVKHNFIFRLFLPDGVNETKNLVPSCRKCNRKKSNYGGLWLVRGYYWKICLPIYKLLRLACILVLLFLLCVFLGATGFEPFVPASDFARNWFYSFLTSLGFTVSNGVRL